MKWAKNKSGFTIVELLIVVVVIAVLAAITIVAFNGITQRAKDSASQSVASQAGKRIQASAIENAETYPSASGVDGIDNLSNLGIVNSGTTSYQYSANNSSNPKTFCLTATKDSLSYYTSSTSLSPTLGACPGHGVNGVPPITNLLTNTGSELNTTNLQNIGSVPDRTVGRVPVGDAREGGYVFRLTIGPSGGVAGYGSLSGSVPVGRYTGSLWIRSNKAISVNPYFEGSATRTNVSSQGATLTPGVWARIWQTVDVTVAGTLKVGFLSGSTIVQNDYVDIDAFMLTSGPTLYGFADGATASWAWNGTAGAATSTGPPL